MLPPLIALEEHFFSHAASTNALMREQYSEQFKHIPSLSDKLTDLDGLRLSNMKAGQVSLQIISHAPGTMTPNECKDANDQLFAAIKQHPSRYAGFAVLPVANPQASAAELTRCVKELGFVGALVSSTSSCQIPSTGSILPIPVSSPSPSYLTTSSQDRLPHQ